MKYFCNNKINKNETKQNILLEMCGYTCFHTWHGTYFYGIDFFTQYLKKVADKNVCNFFYFYN